MKAKINNPETYIITCDLMLLSNDITHGYWDGVRFVQDYKRAIVIPADEVDNEMAIIALNKQTVFDIIKQVQIPAETE